VQLRVWPGGKAAWDCETVGWRCDSIEIEFRESTQWQMVSLVNDRTVLTDIDSVVIDTIVPAPGAATWAIVGCEMAGRKRR